MNGIHDKVHEIRWVPVADVSICFVHAQHTVRVCRERDYIRHAVKELRDAAT